MQEFDTRAKDWDLDPRKIERAEAVAADIRRQVHLSADMRALEYGCGTGLLSFDLQPHLGHITVADSSEGMLQVLQQKIADQHVHNMTPIKLDLTADFLPDTPFDLIYTLMTLHHIPDTQGMLRQFHTLLKHGGVLYIADLDNEDGSFHGPEFSGHHGFDRNTLEQDLRATGFSEIHFRTSYTIRKQLADGIETFPVLLMTAINA